MVLNDVTRKPMGSSTGALNLSSTDSVTSTETGDFTILTLHEAGRKFLDDPEVQQLFYAFAQEEQYMANALNKTAASLSAQDSLDHIRVDTDEKTYLNTADSFLNEVVSDSVSVDNLLSPFEPAKLRAEGLQQKIVQLASGRGLDYEEHVKPWVDDSDSPVGEKLRAATLGLEQAHATLDLATVDYTNRVADKANQYLQGFDLVKKNLDIKELDALATTLGRATADYLKGGMAAVRGFSPLIARLGGTLKTKDFNYNNVGHLIGMSNTTSSMFWKGSASSYATPALKQLFDTKPSPTADEIDNAVQTDLNNALGKSYGDNGALKALWTKAEELRKKLEEEQDGDSGWYIPSV